MTESLQHFLEQFHTTGCADAFRYMGCHFADGGAVFRVWGAEGRVCQRGRGFQFLE